MKKTLAIILSICFVVCLTACSKDETTSDVKSDNSQIISTENQTSDLTNSNESSESSTTTETSELTESSKSTATSKPTESSKPTQSSKPVNSTHTHSFSAATCTTPQKCSCGETKGSASGHKWQEATCKAPKTCSVCKSTEGDKLKHKYNEDGICSACNLKDPTFTYPMLSSMDGVWKTYFKSNDGRLMELFYYFSKSPLETPCCAGVRLGLSKEELGQIDKDLNDFQSVTWEGTTYYLTGGGFVVEGLFEEYNDKIVVTDGYSNNSQIVFQRISTNTIKVVSYDSGIEFQDAPIGTVLTFSKN